MPKIDKYIEVVMTYIADLDIMSLKTCKTICNVLRNHYTKVGFTIIKTKSDLTGLVQKNPDLVFSGVKYVEFAEKAITKDSTNKIWLSDYLNQVGINYTGSPKSALELEFSKGMAKKKIQQCGIRTAPFFVAQPKQYQDGQELPLEFPLFVKPLYQGGGAGIGQDSIVINFSDFQKKVQAVHNEYIQSSLVEKYLTGREFTVAIFDASSTSELIAMPVELIAQADDKGNRILGLKEKGADQEEVTAITDQKVREMIISLAKQAFKALGARAFGRIDIRMDENNVPHFLEANLVPGLGSGYFFRACEVNKKMTYEDMILKIAEIGLARKRTILSPSLVVEKIT
jgi:D-alanine-D-alanine ligase